MSDDFLADNDFFGARTVLLSSASSKTAYGTAYQLIQRPDIEVVGLTSPDNRAFCESVGCYSRVLSYDQLGGAKDLPGPRPTLCFAPAQVKKRQADWGPAELGKRLVQAWRAFSAKACNDSAPWLQVQHHQGPPSGPGRVCAGIGGPGRSAPGTHSFTGLGRQ